MHDDPLKRRIETSFLCFVLFSNTIDLIMSRLGFMSFQLAEELWNWLLFFNVYSWASYTYSCIQIFFILLFLSKRTLTFLYMTRHIRRYSWNCISFIYFRIFYTILKRLYFISAEGQLGSMACSHRIFNYRSLGKSNNSIHKMTRNHISLIESLFF